MSSWKERNEPVGIYTVHWNCHGLCNMKCKFCYLFLPSPNIMGTNEACMLIRKILSVNAREIVLGGGDPLQRKDIVEIAKYAKDSGLIVRLDTNGLLLNDDLLFRIYRYIDRIALPLEGASQQVHDYMRSYNGHFRLVINFIKKLSDMSIPLKVNTVVTKVNYNEMRELALLLSEFDNIYLWSAYQFSPLGRGFKFRRLFEIDDTQFRKVAEDVLNLRLDLNIEFISNLEKTHSYFLISPDGIIYTQPPPGRYDYIILGHILRDNLKDILDKGMIDTEKNFRRYSRYEKKRI